MLMRIKITRQLRIAITLAPSKKHTQIKTRLNFILNQMIEASYPLWGRTKILINKTYGTL